MAQCRLPHPRLFRRGLTREESRSNGELSIGIARPHESALECTDQSNERYLGARIWRPPQLKQAETTHSSHAALPSIYGIPVNLYPLSPSTGFPLLGTKQCNLSCSPSLSSGSAPTCAAFGQCVVGSQASNARFLRCRSARVTSATGM